jgi:hypothetical protein
MLDIVQFYQQPDSYTADKNDGSGIELLESRMTGNNITYNNNTTNQWFNITINNTFIENSGGADGVRRSLNLFNSVNDRLDWGGSRGDFQMPRCGCLPTPNVGLSGVPAGEGLRTNPQGWPENTVETAGGYRIVAEGNTNWSVYAPGQNPGDKPHTRVHGDPHVAERDGTNWDFTKDSDFVLPDGTRIFADTDYDAARGNGQSVTKRLVISNGADRIEVDGIDRGRPELGQITPDAYEWRALHLTNPEANGSNRYGQAESQHDAFHLTGDRENVHWVRERDGNFDGVVKNGSRKIDAGGHQIYEQDVDPTLNPTTARELRPAPGSREWGNALRSQLNDAQATAWRQLYGQDIGALGALQGAYGIHGNHIEGEFRADMMDWMFGGLPGYFNAYQYGPFAAMYDMISLLRSDSDWRTQFRNSQYDTTFM